MFAYKIWDGKANSGVSTNEILLVGTWNGETKSQLSRRQRRIPVFR
jgi:hypothetical protein